MKGHENLRPIPIKTTERAKELGSKGGKASGEAKKQKKLMIEMYGDFLGKKHHIKVTEGQLTELEGQDLVDHFIKEALYKNPHAMIKEFREAIDGNKIQVTDDIDWTEHKDEVIAYLKKKNNAE